MPSPSFKRPASAPKTAINISELLADLGYADADTLRALVRAWLELWKLIRPDVIVTDYAPSAILSARIASIHTLPLGPGFSIPPGRDPMPAYREEQRTSLPALRAADHRLLPAINEVAKAFGRASFDCVGELFANPSALITSFPELDPFGPRDDAHYVGPVKAAGRFTEVEWLGTKPARVFAYLQPTMVGLDAILAGLRQPETEVVCVIPGALERIVSRYQSVAFRVFTSPVQLDGLLPNADAVVNYSSVGMVSSSLQAGAPMLLFPTFLEHQLTAARAARIGAAVVCLGAPTREGTAKGLEELLRNEQYKLAAKSMAKKYSNYRHGAAIEHVARAIAES